MTTFLTPTDIRSLWKASLKTMVNTCRSDGKVPEELAELIKHNFYAKFVYYNSEQDTIEIGVNEAKQRVVTYPYIKVYQFPIKEMEELILASFQSDHRDLEFYVKILKGRKSEDRMIIF